MKRYMFRILSAMLVIFLLFSSVACGSSSSKETGDSASTAAEKTVTPAQEEKKPTTLTMICGQEEWPDGFDEIVDKIKQDEGIEIDKQLLQNPYDVIKVKIATNLAPDIFLANVPQTVTLFNAQINCVPLDDQPWVDRLVNPELIRYQEDGHIYAMPILQSSSFFGACYYNKKLLNDIGIVDPEPQTYAEFLAILDKIKNSGKDIVPLFASDKDSWTTQIFATLGLGVALKDRPEVWDKILKNEMNTADVPEFVDVLTKFQELYKKGYINKNHMSATYDNAKEAVGTGKAAMILQGEWVVNDIVTKYNTELGSFIVPFADKPIMGTGAYVKAAWIPKDNANVEISKKWLNLLSQPKYMNEYYVKHPDFPAFKDIDGGKVYPCVKNLVDKYIATGNYTQEFNSHFDAISSVLGESLWPALGMLALQKMTPKEVLQAFDKDVKKAAKDKKLPGF